MASPVAPLTILFVPLDGVGHHHGCIGHGEQLLSRGHKVVFAVQDSWKNKLSPYGFVEEWLYPEHDLEQGQGQGGQASSIERDVVITKAIKEEWPVFTMTPEQQIAKLHPALVSGVIQLTKDLHSRLKAIVAKVKPDVIVADLAYHLPAIMDAGIPWILSITLNPSVIIFSKDNPPALSGYPTAPEYRQMWESYMSIWHSTFKDVHKEFAAWVLEEGGPPMDLARQFPLAYSPYANIYQYPLELDYTGFRPNPPNFYRFDTFMKKSEKEDFEIPKQLETQRGKGKLIYFSMGTIASREVNVMKRLIGILAKSPNRFIVSKGSLGDCFELAENMWGAEWLPQSSVLPLVDLVITHGGSNTIVDSLYFGKPLIVLPFSLDQPDNAQRVLESGLGTRLHPIKCTEEELLVAIEQFANDSELTARLAKISERMQASNSQSRVADLIEKVARSGGVKLEIKG